MLKTGFLLLLLLSCKKNDLKFDICKSYHLNKPSEVWELPNELQEISGISILNFPKILCINDEEGKMFSYNLDTKTIEKSYKFGKNGDYEDITVKDNTAYVLKSNGTIFQIDNLEKPQKAEIYNTFLKQKNNTEGLFFDKENNRLLIACKNSIETGTETKNVIYAFNLKTNTMHTGPAYSISISDFKYKHKFAPSALAIHPKTKTLFVISSVGKLMIEIGLDGKILHEYSLNYPLFTQPEGLFFTENGDLYISNEGKNHKANILKFNYLS